MSAYVAALQTRANQAREIRTDGAATVMGQQVSVSDEPIESNRVVVAAGMFGATALLALLVSVGLWRHAAKVSRELDEETDRELSTINASLRKLQSAA